MCIPLYGIDFILLIGLAFFLQKPNPFLKSIFNNVAYGLQINGSQRKEDLLEKVENSLRRSNLWEKVKDELDKSALELSGGQQRLCIVYTIAVERGNLNGRTMFCIRSH